MSKSLVIAIDGPAGAGKSSVSKALTDALGYSLLDTGALYRCVAWSAREQGIAWEDEHSLARVAAILPVRFQLSEAQNRVFLGEHDVSSDIRSPEVSMGASQVSAHPEVRRALLGLQRELGEAGAVIAEGRDIGTVVFPHADLKIFLTASATVRAQRRFDELSAKGVSVKYEETLAEIEQRDRQDSQREVAPLKPAEDAVIVDSSGMTQSQVVDRLLQLAKDRM